MKSDSEFQTHLSGSTVCHFWGVGTPVARVATTKIWAWLSGLWASWLPLGCLLFEFLESIGMCSRCLLFLGAPLPRKQRFSWGFADFLGVFPNAPIFHSTPHPCPTPRLLPKDQTSPLGSVAPENEALASFEPGEG